MSIPCTEDGMIWRLSKYSGWRWNEGSEENSLSPVSQNKSTFQKPYQVKGCLFCCFFFKDKTKTRLLFAWRYKEGEKIRLLPSKASFLLAFNNAWHSAKTSLNFLAISAFLNLMARFSIFISSSEKSAAL